MTAMAIRFLLNDTEIAREDFDPDETLLDFLRLSRALTGTKEGCNEGDCGACTVLVGRRDGEGLHYEAVNACIRFTASLNATHVVTIEHLSAPFGPLHPVQQAMVAHHGSQCGFCTPGIVMSLYALWMANPSPQKHDVERALQGNLCRCTGYRPIIDAAMNVKGDVAADPLVAHRNAVLKRLSGIDSGSRVTASAGRVIVPSGEADLAAALLEHPGATIVAGSTDVGLWVTKGFRSIAPVISIGGLGDMQDIRETPEGLRLGAGVSYASALPSLAALHPALETLVWRIGGEQVRNMGTIGGNIANGSPIGDMPPPLIALGAMLELRRGDVIRRLPLQDYFLSYGKQAREPGEFIRAVIVPRPAQAAIFAVHKLSKRRDEDISALLGAFHITLENGSVREARICFGGMAGTPKRASNVEKALTGNPWTRAAVDAALPAFADDYQPLSDWRASAQYRLMAAQNLLVRVHLESTVDQAASLEQHHAA
jgi:xanthine dehydrogenase small subunit